MLKIVDPDYYSPAFFTPHPGSDLYDYCLEHDLSLITSHDQYRRNPGETSRSLMTRAKFAIVLV